MLQRYRLVILAGVAVAIAAGLLLQWPPGSQSITRLTEVEGCMLHQQRCTTTLSDGLEIGFEMGPHPLPTTEPIDLKLTLSAAGVERAEVLFEGRDMYMGFLQYRLKPEQGGTVYAGKGSLSVCVRRLMEWLAIVRLKRDGHWVEIPFAFETLH